MGIGPHRCTGDVHIPQPETKSLNTSLIPEENSLKSTTDSIRNRALVSARICTYSSISFDVEPLVWISLLTEIGLEIIARVSAIVCTLGVLLRNIIQTSIQLINRVIQQLNRRFLISHQCEIVRRRCTCLTVVFQAWLLCKVTVRYHTRRRSGTRRIGPKRLLKRRQT
jgi:hypothetical protein